MLKFLFFLILFYFFYKIVKQFFSPNKSRYQSDPKVRKPENKQATIRKEDIIEASFEEIKNDSKDKV